MLENQNGDSKFITSKGFTSDAEDSLHSKLVSEGFPTQSIGVKVDDPSRGLPQSLPNLELLLGTMHATKAVEKLKPEGALSCFADAKDSDLVVNEADFKDKFGEQVAKTLKEIGCTKIEVSGDRVKLHLSDEKEIRNKIGPWDYVKLDKEISFRVKRDGDTVTIDDGNGLRLKADSRWVKGKDFPSVVISKDKIALKNYPVSQTLEEGLFKDLDKILKAVGK